GPFKLFNENDGAINLRLSSGFANVNMGGWTISHNPSVDYVKILHGPGEGDSEVTTHTMTTDDTYTLYSHGYDYWGNYIGPASVNWSAPFNLTAATGNSTVVSPTTAAVGGSTGVITADHASTDDTTGLFTVNPG